MNNKNIFFSYSRENSDFVVDLAKKLKAEGLNVWLDQLDIPAGSRWDEEIEKALNNADIILAILSSDSVESQNVLDEVSYAIEENKQVLPILFENCAIPFRLRRLQYIDFTKNGEEAYRRLLDVLESETNVAEVKTMTGPIEANEHQTKISTKPTNTSLHSSTVGEQLTPKRQIPPFNIKWLYGLIPVILIVGFFIYQKSKKKTEESIVYSPVVETIPKEQAIWEYKTLASGSIDDYKHYLEEFPNGIYAQQAKDSIAKLSVDLEAQDWNTAAQQNTSNSYQEYMDKYPDGKYLEKANILLTDLKDWEKAKNSNTVESYLEYYEKHQQMGSKADSMAYYVTKAPGHKIGWIPSGRSSDGALINQDRVLGVLCCAQGDVARNVKSIPIAGEIVQNIKGEARGIYAPSETKITASRIGTIRRDQKAYVLEVATQGNYVYTKIVFQE